MLRIDYILATGNGIVLALWAVLYTITVLYCFILFYTVCRAAAMAGALARARRAAAMVSRSNAKVYPI